MKKALLALCLLWEVGSSSVYACDACGCGVGNSYFGILPQFHRNFVGLRYRYRSFNSRSPILGSPIENPTYSTSNEQYQTVETWGRFYPARRVQVFAFLPYSFSHRVEDGVVADQQGLGDVTVLANYNVFNTSDSIYQPVMHSLLVGGGLKLPTGSFRETENGQKVNPNFQLGTGSLDFMVNAIYTVRYGRLGLNTDFTYKRNTTNRNDYRFGNRYNTAAYLFYVQKIKKLTLMPSAGIYYEHADRDVRRHIYQNGTGGYAAFRTVGLDAYFKSVAIGANYQHPFAQSVADTQAHNRERWIVNFTFMF